MSWVKQVFVTLLVLFAALSVWVYVSPGAIDTLARYNLAVEPLRQVAALSSADPAEDKGASPKRRGGARQTLVITATVSTGTVNDRLTAIGSGRAAETVAITPLVSGQIVELPAKSGSRIARGEVVAHLDSVTEELALEKARLVAEDLRAKAKRYEELLSRRVISTAEVETARAALATADLAVREAELNLERRTIISPIDGIVGIETVNIGDYVTNQSPIVTIDDRSKIVIEFFVPERFVMAIAPGAPIEASSVARPGEVFAGKVVAVDNRIDVASRTLRVRGEIANNQDKLRAGMAFQVTMRFPGERFPAVDPLAIQWDSRGSYVWQIREDGTASRQDVRIIQRNADSVLVEASLEEGDVVVTEGVQNVRSGAEVSIAGEAPEKPDAGSGKAAGS